MPESARGYRRVTRPLWRLVETLCEAFMTDALRESALILTTLDGLEETIEHLITHPDTLAERRCRASDIRRLHDNKELSRRLIAMYDALRVGGTHAETASMRAG